MSEKIVQLNEEVIKGQLKELVRGSVEETLNKQLEAEAEELTQAARYERNEARQGYRSGHYDRNLTTTSGDVTLHVPRLKGVSFETAIIERYRRRESSVEEALIEMYLAGVSVCRVGQFLSVAPGPRSGRRKAHCGRQVSGDAGSRGRSIPGRQVPALYRPFLPQCLFRDAALQGEAGGQDAQGDPCSGEQESCP